MIEPNCSSRLGVGCSSREVYPPSCPPSRTSTTSRLTRWLFASTQRTDSVFRRPSGVLVTDASLPDAPVSNKRDVASLARKD
ncbi:hypothetical protein Y695_00907 [Hydrogenophaga sp. T4]|nr:hypothetical protein Y695_00907 [Hydrogenophaga sp. T4]